MDPKYFSPTDIRFSLLASQAAICFDNRILGREGIDYEPIETLSIQLSDAVKSDPNPLTTSFLWDTIKRSPGREINKVGDLIYITSLAAQEMSRFRELPKERLEALRQYCIDLSKTSIDYSMDSRRRFIA
jgi:hypothetical protein